MRAHRIRIGVGQLHSLDAETAACARQLGVTRAIEVIAARARGLRCLGFSTITNPAAGITGERLSHAEVMEVARRVAGDLERLVEGVVAGLPRTASG